MQTLIEEMNLRKVAWKGLAFIKNRYLANVKTNTMECANILKRYGHVPERDSAAAVVEKARNLVQKHMSPDVLKRCYGCIDLTTLEPTDSQSSIEELTGKVAGQRLSFPDIPDVAAVCVYPSFVETVGVGLGDSDIRIASVVGGFPASQTYLEVKMLEAAMAVENGADEVDIVMNVGEVLSGEFDEAGSEIEIIREEVSDDITLKVIIESGLLADPDTIRFAALTAMHAGADFVKTSTGKVAPAATPEAAAIICGAIRDYYKNTGKKVGFKAAGGIRTAESVLMYYSIVETVLGDEWLNPSLFRIGTSSVANNLLSAITGSDVKYY